MNVYGIDEYTSNQYEDLMYDRVIVLNLLRSNISICVKDRNIRIFQQPHVEDYCNDTIRNIEEEELRREKSKIEYWVNVHREKIIGGVSTEDIISRYTFNIDDALFIRKHRPVILGIDYARSALLEELERKRNEIISIVGEENDKLDMILDSFHVSKDIQGDETIRFYVDNGVNMFGAVVDINIDRNSIVEVIPKDQVDDTEALKYFCHVYFDLFSKRVDTRDILNLNNDQFVIYSPMLLAGYGY